MNYDELLSLLKSHTINDYEEIGEQEGAATGSGGQAYPTVTKWETGLTRGMANQIDDKVTWRSLYKLTRGKANTLL